MPKDGSATRARLLDAAEGLIRQNGFAATSVDDILEASGSSKGAFFNHFSSKRALAQALVDRYVQNDLEMLGQALAAVADIADPVERAVAFFRHFEKGAAELVAADTACLYVTVLAERNLLEETTTAAVERAIGSWRREVAAVLRPALKAAGASRRISADDLADHLFVTFEGSYLISRSLGSPEPTRAQLKVLRQLVEAVLRPGGSGA